MALVRSDSFRELDRLMQQLWGGTSSTRHTSMSMPMDAWRNGDTFLVQLDLPGVKAESIELTVEDNVLTIKAERPLPPTGADVESLVAERAYGIFTRQMFLGDNLDTEHIEAAYEGGVLTVTIPVAPHAKPRRIEVKAPTERVTLNA